MVISKQENHGKHLEVENYKFASIYIYIYIIQYIYNIV